MDITATSTGLLVMSA